MPSIDVKEKKWYIRLISCFKRQERNDSEDRDKSVFFFKDEFELRLHEENLLYRRSGCNDHPVLNIGIGLTTGDLGGKPSNYRYYGNYRHPGKHLFIHPGFKQVTEEVYYDEPIIDGLPATLWLECIEPTLDILSSLSLLKHRKSNLVMMKPRPTKSDSHYSRHGDSIIGVVEMLSRRLSSALNRPLGEIQDTDGDDNADITHRHPNRRRHEREERVMLNINQYSNHEDAEIEEEERVLLNINQYSNHEDAEIEEEERVLLNINQYSNHEDAEIEEEERVLLNINQYSNHEDAEIEEEERVLLNINQYRNHEDAEIEEEERVLLNINQYSNHEDAEIEEDERVLLNINQYSNHEDAEIEEDERVLLNINQYSNHEDAEIEEDERVLLNINQYSNHEDAEIEEEERVLLNINQSANHDDDVTEVRRESSSSVQQDNLNPDISPLLQQDDDDDDDAVSVGQRESSLSVQQDNLNPGISTVVHQDDGDDLGVYQCESNSSVQRDNLSPEIPAMAQQDEDDDNDDIGGDDTAAGQRELSVQHDNLNPDILEVVLSDDDVDGDFVLEDLESLDEWELPAKYNPTSRDSDREEERENSIERNTATGDSCSVQNLSRSRKKSKRKRAIKPHPHLYFWKPEIRQFEKMELRNYSINTLMLFKCGVKYYFQENDKNNEKELCNRLTYLSRMDFFTRRLILSSTEDFFNRSPTQEITSQEIENARRFLQLKGISPKYGACQLSEAPEAICIESPTPDEGFFRRKMNNVRRFFSRPRVERN
ncbi:hypothetical protein LOTGIDRAFT_235712 [Lottia gigantea]|uniref:Uncharacterized protein n=1 Tax=Lottia gigantea TaxID=225164 RepID=V3Z4W4_LOTGI|nr:hypothetical protein LOTGIDRAFT_235712 [Lottia gigantea]ESO85743.1 hypothetical protein LOTGIDRAFT_235712 [Lottia gigantea]